MPSDSNKEHEDEYEDTEDPDVWAALVVDMQILVEIMAEQHPTVDPDDMIHLAWDAIGRSLGSSTGRRVFFRTAMADTPAQNFGALAMPFGKYKGRRIDDVPLTYLQYVQQTLRFVLTLETYMLSDRVQQDLQDETKRRRGTYPGDPDHA